jgi:hypothetical protein
MPPRRNPTEIEVRLQRIEQAIAEIGTWIKGQWTPRVGTRSAVAQIMAAHQAAKMERRPHHAEEQREAVA